MSVKNIDKRLQSLAAKFREAKHILDKADREKEETRKEILSYMALMPADEKGSHHWSGKSVEIKAEKRTASLPDAKGLRAALALREIDPGQAFTERHVVLIEIDEDKLALLVHRGHFTQEEMDALRPVTFALKVT